MHCVQENKIISSHFSMEGIFKKKFFKKYFWFSSHQKYSVSLILKYKDKRKKNRKFIICEDLRDLGNLLFLSLPSTILISNDFTVIALVSILFLTFVQLFLAL